MSGHTPGPWSQSHRLNRRGSYSTEVYDNTGEEIATVAWYPLKTAHGIGTSRDANARLIAAAPDLLAALQELIEAWPSDSLPPHALCMKVANTINAAKGVPSGESSP